MIPKFPKDAVGADNPGDLAWLDGERHPVQGNGRSETLAQAADFDSCFHARHGKETPTAGRHAGEPSSPPPARGTPAAAHTSCGRRRDARNEGRERWPARTIASWTDRVTGALDRRSFCAAVGHGAACARGASLRGRRCPGSGPAWELRRELPLGLLQAYPTVAGCEVTGPECQSGMRPSRTPAEQNGHPSAAELEDLQHWTGRSALQPAKQRPRASRADSAGRRHGRRLRQVAALLAVPDSQAAHIEDRSSVGCAKSSGVASI